MEPFHRFLQPRIIVSLFVLVSVLTFNSADAASKGCTNSQNCTEPEYGYFCDETFFACMPCAPYCTGTKEMKRHCLSKCPEKYIEVYEREGRQGTLGRQQTSQKTNESGGGNLTVIVIIVAALALGVIPLLVAFALNIRRGRTTGGSQRPQRLRRARYQEMNGSWVVTLEEGNDGNGCGYQADQLPSPQNVLCVNGHQGGDSEGNNYHLTEPNTNIDVESVRSLAI